MNDNTFNEIEAKIRSTENINADRKRELLELLAKLKAEVSDLSQTNDEQARSIAGFAELSTHEATRVAQNPELRELSVKGLRSSVDGFEQSHPKLVQVVNSISNALSNWGI